MVLTSLAHYIDIEFLREAFQLTRKDAAVGADGQTAAEYATNLESNLQSLLDRFKSGTYKAPPVRRVHIPKNEGTKTRPIGIPTFEDKVLQRAVTMVLEAVYEQDFLDCSYGFRPGRSAHQALQRLWQGLMEMRGGWVLEVDIQSFFDTLDPEHLRSFLDQRVRDGVLRRTIGKWLNAGVLEAGAQFRPESGTPQGGVISPLLANIYLHEVLDKWFEGEIRPRLGSHAFLVRYADDAVLVFARESDARRVLTVLAKRFAAYGLTLHPTKTQLVRFRKPRHRPNDKALDRWPDPGTFDLLGFTHYWGRSQRGFWVVKRKTAGSRLGAALQRVSQWCREHRHDPIPEQHRMLVLKLKGHYGYYGITGNSHCLKQFQHEVERVWRKWLCRRSRRASLAWSEYLGLLRRHPLPQPRVVHSVYRQAANSCR
jgi:group II intron reverse transcriptase/maturase